MFDDKNSHLVRKEKQVILKRFGGG